MFAVPAFASDIRELTKNVNGSNCSCKKAAFASGGALSFARAGLRHGPRQVAP